MDRPIRGGAINQPAHGHGRAADEDAGQVVRRDGGEPQAPPPAVYQARSAGAEAGPVIGRDIYVSRERSVSAGRRPTVGQRRPWRPMRIIGLVVAGLLLAALLNADHLVDRADKKPFGGGRDFWLAIWEPVQAVSDALYLNRPRQWLDSMLDREISQKTFQFEATPNAGASPAAVATEPPAGETEAPGGGTQTPQPGGTQAPSPSATATPTAIPIRVRQPTSDAPLKMYIAGDSMATAFGASLSRLASATGLVTPELDARAATGLSRPDYYDWPGRFASKMEDSPDVVVIIFGANDSQGLRTPDGSVFQPLSDGWRTEYRRRVAGTMDLLKASQRLIIWVGQPIMSEAGFSERMADVNAIYREEAAKRPWVEYFDSWPLFADSSGNYQAYLTDDNGLDQLMRASDGIHLTRLGSDRLASAVLKRLNEDATIYP